LKVLVTGGAGFIGSHIVESFVSKGWEVTVLDNFSTGNIENLVSVKSKIKIIEGDIRDRLVVNSAISGAKIVIHLAARVSVPESFKNPFETYEVNFMGTQVILEASLKNNIERVIFASSSAVYGNTAMLPITEENEDNPSSPYGVSKLLGEKLCRFFFEAYGFKTIIFRFFNVYGPRQSSDSDYSAVIPKFLQIIQKGGTPVIFGDGEQTRDFIFISDLVRAHHLALNTDKAFGEPMNLASGEKTSLNRLVGIISDLTGLDIIINYEPPREGDIIHSFCSIENVKKNLTFNPDYNIRSGIYEMNKIYNLNYRQ